MGRMKTSAGILLFRGEPENLEVLLAHPGGPFWARKDAGAWSLPKGEYDADTEDARSAAAREFEEELGSPVPSGEWIDLGTVTQSRAKTVHAFAVRGDFDPSTAVSNEVEMQWPPTSGRLMVFPEVDRVEWCDSESARVRILAGQRPLLDALDQHIRGA